MSSPTRSCLYTGIYPVKSGAYPNHTLVRDGTLSIVQHLARAGYNTALLGNKKRHKDYTFGIQTTRGIIK